MKLEIYDFYKVNNDRVNGSRQWNPGNLDAESTNFTITTHNKD